MGELVAEGARDLDVIVAPATPPGVAALAIVRLSGPAEPLAAVLRALAPGLPAGAAERTAHLTNVLDSEGGPLDDVVALLYRAPRSPTGEDVVELICHGSPAVVAGLLAAACAAGARPARAGEFTRRALANGKLDLAEAEGIARLSSAESRDEARRSLSLVRGALSRRLEEARERLLDLLAALEASLDFAEDVGASDPEATARELARLRAELGELAASAERARPETAPRVVLAGRPNAGKSTLFNALLGSDRAIVAARPGTTRDAVSERVSLAGTLVTLVDTAGVRETEDDVERIGVDVARRAAAGADLVLWLVDGSVPSDGDDGAPPGALLIRTKVDLLPSSGGPAPSGIDVDVSAATGSGVVDVARLVAARLGGSERADGLLVLARHGEALLRAGAALELAEESARSRAGDELVAAEVRRALFSLGEITGETATEELLERIFSSFCIGK
ncbi:MAG TPA: tRNA uridine-5-carboxymethylaminomethyl(34) synthesis GTPase MnmE [Thermoanaerobaculia bacterium]|nr:tRNA uridine-5-carboxymethylaminomethyl(34) synthesis GTPase MnmE [Thermoanaerobaculia bacterium]